MDLTFVVAQRERETFPSTGGRKLRGSKEERAFEGGARLEIETASIILKLPQRNRDVSVEGDSSTKVNVVSPRLLGVRGQCKQIPRSYLTFPRRQQDVSALTAPANQKVSSTIFGAIQSLHFRQMSVRYDPSAVR